MTRKYTNQLLELVDEYVLKPEEIVMMCLNYMSEADVEDMCRINGIDLFPEEGEEDV